MIAGPSRPRPRAEAYADWLGLAYRGCFFVLVSTPIWATLLALVILWERLR